MLMAGRSHFNDQTEVS